MFFKYPKIKSLPQFVAESRLSEEQLGQPVLFKGTVKVHGTNAAVVFRVDNGKLYFQSRNRIISVGSDNHGFAAWASEEDRNEYFKDFLESVAKSCNIEGVSHVVVYGEFAGGKISPNVALQQKTEPFFSAFDVFAIIKDETEKEEEEADFNHVSLNAYLSNCSFHEGGIYNMREFPTVEVSDYSLMTCADTLFELAESVANKCPVASAFGIEGKGEGIVFEVFDTKFKIVAEGFKSRKGDKLPSKTDSGLSALEYKALTLVHDCVTEQRMQQGIDFLKEQGKEITMKEFGNYINWIASDLIQEESYRFKDDGIDPERVAKLIRRAMKHKIAELKKHFNREMLSFGR